jgi:uncharacterized protein
MLTRFLPKNEKFFEHFRQAANIANEIAVAFQDMLENYTDVERKVANIREIEHRADAVAHTVTNALSQTFVTPIDREDIVLLANRIDDFVDAVEDAARRMWLYRIPAPTEHAKKMSRIISAQAKLLTTAIPMLEVPNQGEEMRRQAMQIRSLESEADVIIDAAMASLYDGAGEIPSLVAAIRWGELYGYLEDATDRAQDVANALEEISLKNA